MRRVGPLLAMVLLLACGVGSAPVSSQSPAGLSSAPSATGSPRLPSPPVADSWPAYQHDGARTGAGPDGPAFNGVRRAWAADLDQEVYAQPLYVRGHVIVATENNTVYSLDGASGAISWERHFGDPIRRSALPCGNIDPTGITSTPVADLASGTLFAVAYLPPFHHELFALDLGTGEVRWHQTVDPPGVAARPYQQRSALSLLQGRVYIPYGGLAGDCAQYTGWVVGVSADGQGTPISYRVPTTREGGIWAPGGMAADSSGTFLVAIGNASSTTSFDYGNAVVRLRPDLSVGDFWAPSNWAELSRTDLDIGSMQPLPLPGGLVFQAGKAGVGYLLRSSALGGIGGEVFSAPICPGGAFGAPAFRAGVIYLACGGAINALTVGAGRFDVAWKAPGGWSPMIAFGSVWSLAGTEAATLIQLDPLTGAVRSRTSVGATNHFCVPSAGDGRLYVPAGTHIVALAPAA